MSKVSVTRTKQTANSLYCTGEGKSSIGVLKLKVGSFFVMRFDCNPAFASEIGKSDFPVHPFSDGIPLNACCQVPLSAIEIQPCQLIHTCPDANPFLPEHAPSTVPINPDAKLDNSHYINKYATTRPRLRSYSKQNVSSGFPLNVMKTGWKS